MKSSSEHLNLKLNKSQVFPDLENLQVSICKKKSYCNMSQSNTDCNNSNNSNYSSNNNGSSSPSMQELVKLLSDQSKVINNLQKTIDGLNGTISSLNIKIERMEDYSWLNGSFDSFKVKCKQLLL